MQETSRQIPDLIHAATGWRTWEVRKDALCAIGNHPLSVNPWNKTMQAACIINQRPENRDRQHLIPEPSCACGLHACYDHKVLKEIACDVVGVTRGWGNCQAHYQGFRTEYAQIVALAPNNCLLQRPLLKMILKLCAVISVLLAYLIGFVSLALDFEITPFYWILTVASMVSLLGVIAGYGLYSLRRSRKVSKAAAERLEVPWHPRARHLEVYNTHPMPQDLRVSKQEFAANRKAAKKSVLSKSK